MDPRHLLLPLLAITHIAHAAADARWPLEYTLPKNSGTSAAAGSGVPNNLMVTSTGTIVCAFSETPSSSSSAALFLTSSTDDGASWSSPLALTPLATMPLGLGQPATALDANDDVHLVWSGRDISSGSAVLTLFYAQFDLGTGAWSNQAVIASAPRGDQFGYYHVTVDRQSRVHVIWHEGSEESITHSSTAERAEVFHKLRPAGSSTFLATSTLSAIDGYPSAFPVGDFGGTSGNTLAICWRNQMGPINWDVQMVVSTDGGQTWGAPFVVAGGTGNQWDPYVLVDKNGVFHLGYHTNDIGSGGADFRLYVGHSTDQGATWQNQGGASGFLQVTPSNELHEFAKMAYDSKRDVVWLGWKRKYGSGGGTGGGNDCYVTYIRDSGDTIQTSYEQVSDSNGAFATAFNDIAVGPDGRPCVTFQTKGDYDPVTGATSLYFRKRSLPVIGSSFSAGWVYGGNVGWFNFDWGATDEDSAPQLSSYIASGYVYAGNLGWLHLGDGSPADGVQYSQLNGDYGVNIDSSTGLLSGHAYGANFGWVKFDWGSTAAMGANAPMLDLTTGKFSGYAYGANIGWIKLDAASTAYLAVNAIASGEDSDGDGLPDAFEYATLTHAGQPRSLTVLNASTDLDLDGVTDLVEFQAGTSAASSTDTFRTTNTEMTAEGIVLDWTVVPGRVYDIQCSPSLAAGTWVNIATGLKPPAGAREDGVVIALPEDATRQFYRVVVRNPLAP